MTINKNLSSYLPPFTVSVINATDAFYFADVMGIVENSIVVSSLSIAKELADAYFVIKNWKWESLEEMNNCDGGYDVRVYDKHKSCVYAAHETFKQNWIGKKYQDEKFDKQLKMRELFVYALEEAKEQQDQDNK